MRATGTVQAGKIPYLLQAQSAISVSRAQQADGDETYLKSSGIAILRKAEIVLRDRSHQRWWLCRASMNDSLGMKVW
jgi:hypothetical protein